MAVFTTHPALCSPDTYPQEGERGGHAQLRTGAHRMTRDREEEPPRQRLRSLSHIQPWIVGANVQATHAGVPKPPPYSPTLHSSFPTSIFY